MPLQDPSMRWRLASTQRPAKRPATEPAPAPAKPERVVVAITAPVAMQAASCVRIPLFAQITGYTEKAVERKIERGEWAEGKHYHRRDGNILIDMDGYAEWVRGGKR